MQTDLTPRTAQLRAVAKRFTKEAREYAARVRELVELDGLFEGDRDRLVLELAGTARMGQDRAAGELDRALRLNDHFPRALQLLGRGEMLVATAQILLSVSKSCSAAVQDELGRRLPDRIAGLDAADARPLVAQTILEVEAELERAEQQGRYAKARANRGVWVFQVEDGMARIGAEIDALAARRFSLDLDELVRAEKVRDLRNGITRTQSQRRADVLAELPARHLALLQVLARGQAADVLAEAQARQEAGTAGPPASDELPLGLPPAERTPCWSLDPQELAVELLRQPVRSPAVLDVHVPMTTLLDLDQQAALVEGLGYVPGWLARTLLPDAALRRVAVNAATGIPLHLDPLPRHGREHPPDAPPGPGRRRPPPDRPPGLDSRRPRHDASPRGPGGHQRPPGGPPGRRAPDDITLAEPQQLDLGSAGDEARPGGTEPCPAAAELARTERQQAKLLAMLRPVRLRDTTEPQHDPSAGLRRLVQVRDLRCTGPGCPRSAQSCHLDHEQEYALGGPTSEPNLSAKSPRCHRARHAGWTAERDRRTGVTTWTSPDGSVFTRLPAWRPHAWHPEVLHPPLPRAEQLPEAETDYPVDRPLWVPPPLPEGRTPRPAPEPQPTPRPAPKGRGWYDQGEPPPF